jgi:hypothetical protein
MLGYRENSNSTILSDLHVPDIAMNTVVEHSCLGPADAGGIKF